MSIRAAGDAAQASRPALYLSPTGAAVGRETEMNKVIAPLEGIEALWEELTPHERNTIAKEVGQPDRLTVEVTVPTTLSVLVERDQETKEVRRAEVRRAGLLAWEWSPDDEDEDDEDKPLPDLIGSDRWCDREWDLLKGLCLAAGIPTDVGTASHLQQRLLKAARDGKQLREFIEGLGK